MNKISVFRDLSGNICKMELKGHTCYAPEGSDIVCASISSAVFSALNGIENIVGVKFGYEQDDGYLLFVLPNEIESKKRQNINVLLESMLLFLKELQKQYPSNIQIAELEV